MVALILLCNAQLLYQSISINQYSKWYSQLNYICTACVTCLNLSNTCLPGEAFLPACLCHPNIIAKLDLSGVFHAIWWSYLLLQFKHKGAGIHMSEADATQHCVFSLLEALTSAKSPPAAAAAAAAAPRASLSPHGFRPKCARCAQTSKWQSETCICQTCLHPLPNLLGNVTFFLCCRLLIIISSFFYSWHVNLRILGVLQVQHQSWWFVSAPWCKLGLFSAGCWLCMNQRCEWFPSQPRLYFKSHLLQSSVWEMLRSRAPRKRTNVQQLLRVQYISTDWSIRHI